MSVTVGRERHRFCEPLFDTTLLRGLEGLEDMPDDDSQLMPLQDACGAAVSRVDPVWRAAIWGGVFVTGDITSAIKGIPAALQSRLSSYLLSNPDALHEVQPKFIRTVRVPDYFAEYREKGDSYAAFLGASIIAKVCGNSSPPVQTCLVFVYCLR